MCHRDMKWANIVRKMAPIDLLPAELPQTFSLGKKNPTISRTCKKWRSWHPVPSLRAWQMGKKMQTVADFISRAPKSLWMVTEAMKFKDPCSLEEKLTNLDSVLKRDITLVTKVHIVKAMVFSSSHVQMWELDHRESWALKRWCFLIVVLEKTLESPLECKEIKPVHPKGNQSWIFFGRTDAEAETLILWPPDAKNWLIGKDPDDGKDWRQEKKGTTEEEMVGWHRLDGHEFEKTPGAGDGQGSLPCCSPWGHKESDTTEWLNWTV